MQRVPVTPAVVQWAIHDAGLTVDAVAKRIKAKAQDVEAWGKGTMQPSFGQAKKLAGLLKRPLTFFLMPSPPASPKAAASRLNFRAPVVDQMRDLTEPERLWVRRAQRLVDAVAVVREMAGAKPVQFPKQQEPAAIRKWLGVSVTQQQAFASPAKAYTGWRAACEARGVLVLSLPLGQNGCRGMSLPNAMAPAIVVNTNWSHTARIFTVFHELAHLLGDAPTDAGGVCAQSTTLADADRSVERKCDEFASALLLPEEAVTQFLARQGAPKYVPDLTVPKRLAKAFHVSLRAATLRLVALQRAHRDLYGTIPKAADEKSGGGRSEEVRTAEVARHGEFGTTPLREILDAVQNDRIDRSQAASWLRLQDPHLDRLVVRLSQGTAVDDADAA